MFKEIAINLKDWEVNAILKGWKTQIRRVIKSPAASMQKAGMKVIQYRPPGDPWYKDYVWSMRGEMGTWGDYTHNRFIEFSPYQVGNWLWARETWNGNKEVGLAYRATNPELNGAPWRSSSTMPRWASRITLEVIGIRVERIQDISEMDCWAEGLEEVMNDFDDVAQCVVAKQLNMCIEDAKPLYAMLWERTHGPGAWSRNDWVWVYEFKRINQ